MLPPKNEAMEFFVGITDPATEAGTRIQVDPMARHSMKPIAFPIHHEATTTVKRDPENEPVSRLIHGRRCFVMMGSFMPMRDTVKAPFTRIERADGNIGRTDEHPRRTGGSGIAASGCRGHYFPSTASRASFAAAAASPSGSNLMIFSYTAIASSFLPRARWASARLLRTSVSSGAFSAASLRKR